MARHQTRWWIKAPQTPPQPKLTELKKAELVAIAQEKGVDAEGTKAELIERLSNG